MRSITVGFEWTSADGNCVELTVHGGDPDERFLIPFGQVEGVVDTMLRVVADGGVS